MSLSHLHQPSHAEPAGDVMLGVGGSKHNATQWCVVHLPDWTFWAPLRAFFHVDSFARSGNRTIHHHGSAMVNSAVRVSHAHSYAVALQMGAFSSPMTKNMSTFSERCSSTLLTTLKPQKYRDSRTYMATNKIKKQGQVLVPIGQLGLGL